MLAYPLVSVTDNWEYRGSECSSRSYRLTDSEMGSLGPFPGSRDVGILEEGLSNARVSRMVSGSQLPDSVNACSYPDQSWLSSTLGYQYDLSESEIEVGDHIRVLVFEC